MKNLFVFLVLFFASFSITNASDVNLYYFWGDGCPHCANESKFLEEMKIKYPELKVYDYEVWKVRDNAKKLQEVGKFLNADVRGVPFTVIGDEYFTGFGIGSTDKQIEQRIVECKENTCTDPLYDFLKIGQIEPEKEKKSFFSFLNFKKDKNIDTATNTDSGSEENIMNEDLSEKFSVPIIGEFNAKDISLPFLTMVIGLIDGFNPCAMWVLIFLITLLIGMKDKKRRWILGGAFIITSGIVYFMFMALWLNLILFIGFIIWVRRGIGILALVSGILSLRSAVKEGAVCKVGDETKKQKLVEKMKVAISQNSFWLALFGIITVAFAVNLIELMCSAGLPAVYTQVLALNDLAVWQYYSYLGLYIFFFMLDDLIVFAIAMKTLEVTKITTKYSKLSKIIGGIIMVVLGLLLLFRPEWIMFG
jgi:glutaredoxin